ncbi:hypothetical protein QNH47_13110 [Virgibacillus halodenitrificans]|uniref:hypothetical protein n=1 Tax=Virgibacillus halodenitrificans TaxID=1482 RepID=UPI0024C070F9|nr:hypothetical protein [Virgibacillus halodenitrificans]WHX25107.1 hypothetical protein QNH47_13110 [Virgibacillus halodenitrificans]
MNTIIKGVSVSDAWKKAINHLVANDKEDYNLIVEIENPVSDDIYIRNNFNKVLHSMGDQSVETVSNTIFPLGMYEKSKDRNNFYERFSRVYPILRKVPENNKGTYFGRLIEWDYGRNKTINQVEHTIFKLAREKQNGRGIRVMYEMSIYDPELDCNNQMGFPCMSFISVKVRKNFIDLTAIYRNQYFVQKAYGNYLGLGRLLNFIAKESGYGIGKLTCIATHATLGPIKPKSNYDRMMSICNDQVQVELDLDV